MPATYQGNKNRNTSVAAWAATTSKSLGDQVHPSPKTGQIFTCTGAGTTGSSQPTAWASPPFPTLGTTITDGSVTWTCSGWSPFDGGAPVIQVPDDDDEPTAQNMTVLPNEALADWLARLSADAAYLSAANTWTGFQDFQGGFQVDSNVEVTSSTAFLFLGTYGGVGNALFVGAQDPTSAGRLLLDYWKVNAAFYGALYLDASQWLNNHSGFTWAINADWNGTTWVQQDAAYQSSWMQLGDNEWTLANMTAGGSYPAEWTPWISFNMQAGGLAAAFGLPVYAQDGLNVSGGNLDVTGNVVVSGDLSVGATFSTPAIVAGTVTSTGALNGQTLDLSGDITGVSGHSTQGIGVPICIAAVNSPLNIPSGTSHSLFVSAPNVGATFYELKVWFFAAGGGNVAADKFTLTLQLSVDGNFPLQNDSGHAALIYNDSGNVISAAVLPFSPATNQTVQLEINYTGGGSVNVFALLFQLF